MNILRRIAATASLFSAILRDTPLYLLLGVPLLVLAVVLVAAIARRKSKGRHVGQVR